MPLSILKSLFYPTEKIVDVNQHPHRYRIRGIVNNEQRDFQNYDHDFHFVSYKDVIAGGLLRSELLFGKSFRKLAVHKLQHGAHKQWFIAEIYTSEKVVSLGKEHYFPFLTISYSYNAVNAIKFDIGIYRSQCTNGLVFANKSITFLKVKPENLFDMDAAWNSCLLDCLLNDFERSIKIFQRTIISEKEIIELTIKALQLNVEQDNHEGHPYFVKREDTYHQNAVEFFTNQYVNELGSNVYAALNVITELATYPNGRNRMIPIEQNNETLETTYLYKQRLAGMWLEKMTHFLEMSNNISIVKDWEQSNFGVKPLLESYQFNMNEYLKFSE